MSYDERGAPRQFRDQPRYAPTVERVYRNDQIEVTWEPSFCIHAGECIRGAPDVFDFARRPWVVVDNDTADRIAETVRRCPTGALHYRRLDGAEQEPVPADLVAWAVPKRAAAAARPDQDRRSERRADPRGHPGDVVQVWGVREQAVL